MADMRRISDLAILAMQEAKLARLLATTRPREAEPLPISCKPDCHISARTAQRLADDHCDNATQSLRLEKPVSQKPMMSSIRALLLT